MKIKINKYSFNPILKKVTFQDYVSIDLDSILLITNVSKNTIIYNFANPLFGGTTIDNILTLTYDTSAMSENDHLLIFYEDGRVSPTDIEMATAIENETNWLLRKMVKMLESNIVVDVLGRQKILVEGTVNTYPLQYPAVSNVPGASPYTANVYYQPTWAGPIDPRWTNLDQARMSYNLGIRNNLIFT